MMFASSILRLWVQFKEETRMKKLIALVLAAMLCMAACAALAADLKIGAVMLGD